MKTEKAEPLTIDRLRELFQNVGGLPDAKLAELAGFAALDSNENVDWLPYYKADSCELMGALGQLVAVATEAIERVGDHNFRTASINTVRDVVFQIANSSLLAGVGPTTNQQLIERSLRERAKFLAANLPAAG